VDFCHFFDIIMGDINPKELYVVPLSLPAIQPDQDGGISAVALAGTIVR
jgi:hypothetical protein